MPETTSPHGIQYPLPGDLVKDSAVLSKLAEDMKSLAFTANAAITGVQYAHAPVPVGNSFNGVTTAGAHPIPYAGNPDGVGSTGTLYVGKPQNPVYDIITQLMVSETRGVQYRSARDGVWTEWVDLLAAVATHPAGSRDADALPDGGVYPLPYGASLENGPTLSSGNLLELDAGHPSIEFEQQLFIGADGSGVYYRTGRDKTFMPWTLLGSVLNGLDQGAALREVKVSRFRSRRGGTIGTAGKGVVALRFDHHLAPFRTKVLPLLQKHGLPWAQAINPANLGTGNDDMTMAEIQTMCLETGGEVWNHGRNHGDASTVNAGRREIVQSLNELQAGLPALAIEGFMPPGVAAPGYMGASGFVTPEQWATVLGGMIMANHAAVSGYAGGWYRTLDGHIDVGASHRTMDNAQEYHWTQSIEDAAALGMGVTFMVHPNYLDKPGYMTTATLAAALGRIAQARDEGRIEVLTPSALLLADVSSGYRRNLLRTGGDVAAGWSETVNLVNPDQRGAVHEVVADLTGTGDATLTVTEGTRLALSQTVTLPGTVRLPFTIPADATGIAVALSGAGEGTAVLRAT